METVCIEPRPRRHRAPGIALGTGVALETMDAESPMGSPPIASSLQVKDSLTNAINLCLSQLDHNLPRACRDNAERFDANQLRNGLAQIITTALAVCD
ncbi:hypothetical protein [Tunturiibacter lichenicola]|uniref:hypothetical protein n=1 Tax=Tunturiibacter lichenicola TaxID=2051959 RepID=UPI003D9BF727